MRQQPKFHALDAFTLADLEGVRLLLRGGSIIDWHRMNFVNEDEARVFLRAQEINIDDPADFARTEAIKKEAIRYLRQHFRFPVPQPIEDRDIVALIMLAGKKGHQQVCACTIIKVMHIIHHLEARELLFLLPTADEEVFQFVEEKVYRIIGGALAQGFPIVEFIGGRKNKDSLYTKLLSKKEATAARIYDKLRFRIVTRKRDDIFPMLNYLHRNLFSMNYVIPGQSTNTLFNFRQYCEAHPHLKPLVSQLQISPDLEDGLGPLDNRFTAPSYRVVHFVAEMPIRLTDDQLAAAPPTARSLGRIIFVQTEFQVIDMASDSHNETGEASHSAYKDRQKLAVMHRLKVGNLPHRGEDKR